jgi:hypothetical protein
VRILPLDLNLRKSVENMLKILKVSGFHDGSVLIWILCGSLHSSVRNGIFISILKILNVHTWNSSITMNRKSNDSDRKTSYQILHIICTEFIIEVICQDGILVFLCDATPKACFVISFAGLIFL